jgi:hypothetical protein
MATVGQFYWPSVGISVAAYGQFFMAANRLSYSTVRDYVRVRRAQIDVEASHSRSRFQTVLVWVST